MVLDSTTSMPQMRTDSEEKWFVIVVVIVIVCMTIDFQQNHFGLTQTAHADILSELNKRPSSALPLRSELVKSLKEEEYDILVVGGGATGMSIYFHIIHIFVNYIFQVPELLLIQQQEA